VPLKSTVFLGSAAGYLLGVFFTPEDGGSSLFRKIAELLREYSGLFTRRYGIISITT
jgi:hypothetical protein